jgi:hypothetical protein
MNDAAEEITEEIEDTPEFEWPTNWRQQIAGDDEKELNHLGKYSTPADLWTKARALEQKLSSGEFKQDVPFPEKGSEEEQIKWRQDHGIPESFEKYELAREVDDDEKEVINQFLEYAHQRNMPADQVNNTVDWFYAKRDQDMELMEQGDKEAQQITEDALRSEWGGEYRAHMNRIEALVDMVPGEGKDLFLDARLPDGTKVRANPDVMKFLLNTALAVNPATIVPPPGGDVVSSIQDEIDQIKEVMRNDRKKYNRDEKMQDRYTQLLTELNKAGQLK